MRQREVKLRQAKKDCYCKLCCRSIAKDAEEIIVFDTSRGTIHLCLSCVENINKVANKEEKI